MSKNFFFSTLRVGVAYFHFFLLFHQFFNFRYLKLCVLTKKVVFFSDFYKIFYKFFFWKFSVFFGILCTQLRVDLEISPGKNGCFWKKCLVSDFFFFEKVHPMLRSCFFEKTPKNRSFLSKTRGCPRKNTSFSGFYRFRTDTVL